MEGGLKRRLIFHRMRARVSLIAQQLRLEIFNYLFQLFVKTFCCGT